MTIVVDCRYVRRVPTGIGAVVAELARRLPDAAPGLHFVYLAHPERPTIVEHPHVTHLVPPFVADGPGTLFALGPWLSRRLRFDVFHATFGLAPVALRGRLVVTVHDTMWLSSPGLVQSPGAWGYAERAFYGPASARALRRADAILVPSAATRDEVLRLRPDAPAVAVTPWGLTTPGLEPTGSARSPRGDDDGPAGSTPPPAAPGASDAVLSRHGLARGEYVLTVGRAAGYKNHHGIVEAFCRAFPEGSREKLALVQRRTGTADALVAIARRHRVADRLVFLPAVSGAELAGLYEGALCLCHASLVEGFGLPILEAMARGCPVVTSRVSAMPEAAGGAALLVDPTDPDELARALTQLREPELRAAQRALGLARARAASWEPAVRETVRAYGG